MNPTPTLLVAAMLLGSLPACEPRGFETDRELLEVTGATDLTSWSCEPEGRRDFRAGWHRGQECRAETRRSGVQSMARMTREADGQVWSILRTWSTTDSARWRRLQDSVTAAIRARAEAGAPCPNGMQTAKDSARLGLDGSGFRLSSNLWRLPEYDLSMSTSIPPPGSRPGLPWSLDVGAYPHGLVACGHRGRPAA